MTFRQSYPFEIHAKTGEPCIRLPSPHTNIIITPPRITDIPAVIETLNNSRVWKQFASTPHPYKQEHANAWWSRAKRESDTVLQNLEELTEDADGNLKVIGGCPVHILRETRDNGEEIFIGDCSFKRSPFEEESDERERERLQRLNDERRPGDPELVWSIGDYLVPSHHGRGIMSAAIGTLLREWAIPRMDVRRISVYAKKGNIGSVKVFEKNGFRLKETRDDYKEITAEGRTGEPKIGLHILEWTYKEVS